MAKSVRIETIEDPTGVEDVTRSVRELARRTRELGESVADVAERELAMAIRISARVRDEVISANKLAEARRSPLSAKLRQDAHEIVDVVADVGTVLAISTVDFFESFTDERRPPLERTRES